MPVKSISPESWNGYYNSYFFGENEGAELIERLLDFAPGNEERKWIKIWSAEERFHHRLWAAVAEKKKIEIRKMPSHLEKIYSITSGFV